MSASSFSRKGNLIEQKLNQVEIEQFSELRHSLRREG
jgi:hypothetical protein